MSTAPYEFLPVTASVALKTFASAPDRAVVLEGTDMAQGLMGALVNAELLAGAAGVVPMIQLRGGQSGVVSIGAARDRIASAPEPVRVLYLAAHAAARRAHAMSSPSSLAPTLSVGVKRSGEALAPLAIPLLVLGVAAIVATAYYASTTAAARVQVDGQNLRQAARVDAVVKLALAELGGTGRISDGAWQAFAEEARQEAAMVAPPVWPWVVGGAVVVAAGGAFAWSRLRGARRGA